MQATENPKNGLFYFVLNVSPFLSILLTLI